MVSQRVRLLRLLPRGGRALLVALVALQLIRAALPAALAVAVGRLTATLFAQGGGQIAAAVAVAGLFFADQVAWLLIQPVRNLLVRRIDGDLRGRMRALATGLPDLATLESPDFQDRISRAIDNGMGLARDRSAGNAAAGQLELMVRMLSAGAAAVVVATYAIPLAAGLLATALLLRAIMRRQWMKIIDKLDADTAGQRYEYYLGSQSVIGAAKDVRLFGLSHWFANRFRAAITRTYGPVWRELVGVLRGQWLVTAVMAVAAAATMGFPAAAVLGDRLEPGRLITIVLAGLGVLAISAMGMEAFDIEYGLRGIAAADELLGAHGAAHRERSPGGGRPPAVTFHDVTFAYPGSPEPVLDRLSVTLEPGRIVAIVGENGAGKTTLVKLLAGLYRPTGGHITVDGAAPHERRPAVTVLFQDFVRYPASLRDNVAPGGATDDAAVRQALRGAGADRLPADLDTLLWREGDGGTDLSGGQWQRVALARALHAVASGRRLLILDEPTANLDVRAEAEFHERVIAQVRDTTTLLISHRLSTVRSADRILLLHDGRVAEDGTHDELLALDGRYARFFRTQAEAFR
jgi:ABC-type multidrug transport system fused ATPase/permease subunit